MGHVPVMCEKIEALLCSFSDGIMVDGTVGQGGHSEMFLSCMPETVSVLGLDRDPEAVQAASARLAPFGNRFTGVVANYGKPSEWERYLPSDKPVRGFLLDLGYSSVQLDTAGRGFSMNDSRALDMRFNPDEEIPSALTIVNTYPEKDLADIIYQFGEDRDSRRIARAIIRARQENAITSGSELRDIIARRFSWRRRSIHPATLTFQALRIYINGELDYLTQGLEAAETRLAPGGRIAVITFHSLEDRIVKRYFRSRSGRCKCPPELPVCICNPVQTLSIITGKPRVADPGEIQRNSRARSAKLRCAERV